MRRRISDALASPARMAAWVRRSYPKNAPEHGHSYLLALCGVDCTTR